MRGGRKNNEPVWRELFRSLKDEAKALEREGKVEQAGLVKAKYLAEGEMPPVPTFEEQVAAAGGRVVQAGQDVAYWHDLDMA
jgi:hypothetical protein